MEGPPNTNLVAELMALGWSEVALQIGMRFKFRCHYCDRDLLDTIDDYDSWQHDHLIPQSKHGSNDPSNLILTCKHCNFLKRNFDPRTAVGENASETDLLKAAADHVRAARHSKQLRLEKIRELLKLANLYVDRPH